VGYRLAQHLTNRGLATAAVRDLCGRATSAYDLRTLNALAVDANLPSRRVLEKNGFTPTSPDVVNGKPAHWYTRT
jgi:ribosomal-protein-alanine N-acetyltransferase